MIIDNSYYYAKSLLGNGLLIDNYTIIHNIQPRIQDEYGKNNCTITSISSILEYYLNGSIYFTNLYNHVHKYSKKTKKYNKVYGTVPFFIGSIMDDMNKQYNLNLQVSSSYFNKWGFNYNSLVGLLKNKNPIILSVYNANKGYYKYHSVIVKGYMKYTNRNKECKLLVINDNWHYETKFLDYDTLSSISMINYFT